ncbi:MAG: bifunctional 5,10-methylenetetrahydrofolate dehydrogenase/5,10-methenyltetrahydrofolate cyclohydrolase [Bacilli bacterium]|nr:bifunctional 5,10-methylenetetrahydrofolate dehydrogenase/5,10-methenyltetrahydrofolate cyclohydrolase [Bacilli bacterium]
MNKIIDGKTVRDIKKEELIKQILKLNKQLSLVVISVGDDEASKVYVSQKEKMAKSIGYNFINLHYEKIETEELVKKIKELNKDKSITGIIVQLPLPMYLDKEKIINSIDPLKDVDGLTNDNLVKLIKKKNCLIPCTPKGIMSLLEYYNVDLTKKIVIVGRSELVGLPLFHLLLAKNATVTLCHSKTLNLQSYTKKADILIVAVGKKWLITKNMVKKDAVLIDVGINRIGSKLYGDIEDTAIEKSSLMTPVPGGVGPMTVISLMENVYLAYLFQEKQLS